MATSTKMGRLDVVRQRGDALIEALVGAIIVVVLIVGTNAALNETLGSQRYVNTQNLTRFQIHELIQDEGIQNMCDGTAPGTHSLGGVEVSFATNCQSPSVTLAINNDLSVTIPAGEVQGTSFRLATTSTDATEALLGGDGVVSVGY